MLLVEVALLMDADNGEILSLVSLPDFDINIRALIKDKNILTRLQKEFMNLVQFSKLLLLPLLLKTIL